MINDEPFEHLWRVRRRGHRVDAELRDTGSDGHVEVRFLYDGTLAHRRLWPSRSDAIADAYRRRTELERSGWILHW